MYIRCDEISNKAFISHSKKIKTEKKNSKPVIAKVKGSKPIILDAKWTNYSPQFLEHKFCIPKDLNLVESRDIYQIDTSYQNIHLQPLPDITAFNLGNPYEEYSSSCSSPRDVNEISMHISLIDTQDAAMTEWKKDRSLVVLKYEEPKLIEGKMNNVEKV